MPIHPVAHEVSCSVVVEALGYPIKHMADVDDDAGASTRTARIVEVLDFLSAGIFVESMVTIDVVQDDELARLEERLNAFSKDFIRTRLESDQRLETIVAQKEAIARLSSPILEIGEGIILLPIIGTLDDRRVATLLPELLQAIIKMHARVVILDLTGVNASGTEAIAAVRGMIQAAQLMGCQTVMCGICASFAQNLAQSGVDVGNARIAGRLKDALRIAMHEVFPNQYRRAP